MTTAGEDNKATDLIALRSTLLHLFGPSVALPIMMPSSPSSSTTTSSSSVQASTTAAWQTQNQLSQGGHHQPQIQQQAHQGNPQHLVLNGLPIELVFHVLSFLPASDIISTVPLVCHLWRALTRDQTLWKCVVQREFNIVFSDEAARQMDVVWSQYCRVLLSQREDFDISYFNPERKILGCRHYQRNNKIIAECCQRLFVCRHCHNAEKDHQIDRYATKFMYCMACRTIQPKGQVCTSPVCEGKSMASYYCGVCNFWDDMPEKAIFHCPDCNVCYLGKGLGIDYYHCTECNMCFDKRYESNHRHIPRKKLRPDTADAEPPTATQNN